MWWTVALAAAAAPFPAGIRGMTVSTPTWGWEWGTPAMDETLSVLRADGVSWVAIHPYASVSRDGTVRSRPIDPAAPPVWLSHPVEAAHAEGLKLLVVPHLAYWGSGFTWRGDIAFPDDESRARFAEQYRAFVVAVARAVPGADGFVVGSELDRTLDDEAAWRQTIAAVRQVYDGPLTYAANWDRVDQVPFWDALDAIGVQAYFPLLPKGAVPEPAALDAAWDTVLLRMRGLSQRVGKPVLFTELGYDAGPDAASEPWASGHGRQGDAAQVACLDAALRALDREPAVVGAFLWKWFPGELPRGDFRMSAPELQAVLRARWAEPR